MMPGGTNGYVTEAVVLTVYFPEEDDRSLVNGIQKCITCDVRTIGLKPRYLSRVPVFQSAHGLYDEDLFTPRPSRQNITGGTMRTEQSGTGKPTAGENLDGDHVLVGFLENSPARPFIYPIQIPHPNARNLPSQSAGHVRRIRHNGVLVQWDADGNWSVDARGAAKTILGSSGTEESNSGSGGAITLQTKDGAGDESSITLDTSGGAKILNANGDYVDLPKSGTAEWKATIKAAINSPLVDLSTAPREPVLKATSYLSAETALYALLTTYFAAVKPIWDQIAQAGAPQKIDIATEAASAASAWAGGLSLWATNALKASSMKVQAG
jgi:hypothetical protein